MGGRAIAITVFTLTTALSIGGLVLMLAAGEPFSFNEALVPAWFAFTVVGFLIALKRPGNAVAWICFAVGFVWAVESFLSGAAFYGLAHPGTVPQPEVVAAIGVPLWAPGLFGVGTFVFMLFPDGRLPSPRWRWLPWLAGIGLAVFYFLLVFANDEVYAYGREGLRFDNPLNGALGPPLDDTGPLLGFLEIFIDLVFITILASVAALVIRYRRSAGIERQQLKWLATAGSIVIIFQLISIMLVDRYGETVGLVAGGLLVLIPVSIGIAVLRYRLYEIDRLVSRTATYAVVVGMLAAVYAVIAVALPQLVGLPRDSPLLVAGATLAVAALFSPLRRRVQSWVDRRFNRARYDSQQEVDHFAEQLRTRPETDDLTDELIGIVAKTMEPVSATVWVRDDPHERR